MLTAESESAAFWQATLVSTDASHTLYLHGKSLAWRFAGHEEVNAHIQTEGETETGRDRE